MALRDAGWHVVNLACGLGSNREKQRREREVREACRRARFDLRVSDVLHLGGGRLVELVSQTIEELAPAVVVAPSPHDAHPGHETVGRAAVAACESLRGAACPGTGEETPVAPRLWLWGIWADLPFPTIAVGFGDERMNEVLSCLEAHEGEIARNDYRRLVHGRAEMNASVGPERVFGFGSEAPTLRDREFVELVCEVVLARDGWLLGRPRWLDASDPLGSSVPLSSRPIGEWLHGP
jgi:LmbE family N-acetylglucosaminyl deacetylase